MVYGESPNVPYNLGMEVHEDIADYLERVRDRCDDWGKLIGDFNNYESMTYPLEGWTYYLRLFHATSLASPLLTCIVMFSLRKESPTQLNIDMRVDGSLFSTM